MRSELVGDTVACNESNYFSPTVVKCDMSEISEHFFTSTECLQNINSTTDRLEASHLEHPDFDAAFDSFAK